MSDQAAFHEGYSDIVALLSVFKSDSIIHWLLEPLAASDGLVPVANLTTKKLSGARFARLAEQMGAALSGVPGSALRESLKIKPDRSLYKSERFQEAHDRGELLVAIVLHAFFEVWVSRLSPIVKTSPGGVARSVVVEEGVKAATHLLRILIRALDYMPPVDLTFGDYLSAVLTADIQLNPNDGRYRYREVLRSSFEAFGVDPASNARTDGAWKPPRASEFTLVGTHFERMQRDPVEVFRFVWENKRALGIHPDAFTRVTSVRPVVRVSNDHTILRETVVEYIQQLTVYGSELSSLGIKKPSEMPTAKLINLFGGGTMVFNEYGLLKFHIGTGVTTDKQTDRLQSLWDRGHFAQTQSVTARIAAMHRDRELRPSSTAKGDW